MPQCPYCGRSVKTGYKCKKKWCLGGKIGVHRVKAVKKEKAFVSRFDILDFEEYEMNNSQIKEYKNFLAREKKYRLQRFDILDLD